MVKIVTDELPDHRKVIFCAQYYPHYIMFQSFHRRSTLPFFLKTIHSENQIIAQCDNEAAFFMLYNIADGS
jgi:hypothetical protein